MVTFSAVLRIEGWLSHTCPVDVTHAEPRTRSAAEPLGPERARREAGPSATRTGRDRVHDRWAVALIVATWAWVVLPRLVQSLTAPKFAASVGVESPPYSAPASLTLSLLTLALFGLCGLILIDTVRDPHPGRLISLALLLAPWVFLTIRDMYIGQDPNRASLAYPLVVLTVWRLRPRIEVLRSLGYLVGVAALLSIALAVVLPEKGILVLPDGGFVSEEKGIVSDGILIGFLTQGNNLGQFVALGLPFAALAPRRSVRWALILVSAVALVWTASRSSFGAVGFALLALLAIRLVRPAARTLVGPVISLLPFGLVCVLPFLVHDPEAFTNRGFIWARTLEDWHRNLYVGLGADWFARVGRTSDRIAGSVFNGHNQFVHLAVTGGLVLLVLVGLQLVWAALRCGRMAQAGQVVGVVYLATLAGASLLEKSLVIVDNTAVFPVVVLPLAVLMCGDYGRSPGEPSSGEVSPSRS